ncbi:putative immunity protein [Pararhizobium sp. PWRC1-1]|uniref:putative immunity protein n=1 Tax=Pararhizobium sp. PWRC1-1 TaxID=2804566 RepID=UPI003CEA9B0D
MKKYSKDDQVALAVWALDCAERVLPIFERNYPDDERPRNALKVGREWVCTRVFSMPAIRSASLSAHASAKDVKADQAACEAAHAAGQAVATAHVPQHAYGGAYYALRAIIADRPEAAEQFAYDERAWQSAQLPDHLREEIMTRIILDPRKKGLFVTIQKGPGF